MKQKPQKFNSFEDLAKLKTPKEGIGMMEQINLKKIRTRQLSELTNDDFIEIEMIYDTIINCINEQSSRPQ